MDRLRSGRFPPSGGERARRPRSVGGGRPPFSRVQVLSCNTDPFLPGTLSNSVGRCIQRHVPGDEFCGPGDEGAEDVPGLG